MVNTESYQNQPKITVLPTYNKGSSTLPGPCADSYLSVPRGTRCQDEKAEYDVAFYHCKVPAATSEVEATITSSDGKLTVSVAAVKVIPRKPKQQHGSTAERTRSTARSKKTTTYSSGDETANVNFFTATCSTTFTQCALEATDCKCPDKTYLLRLS